MVQITVSDELARAIEEAGAVVTLVDSRGRAIGQLAPVEQSDCPPGMTSERWSEIKRRMQEPGTYLSYREIKEHLGW